jgi:SsrA-binding protein
MVMAKKKSQTKTISNKRARFDYQLGDEIIAGIVLTGKETKSLRMGHGHLRGAYITAKDGELWLINATITGHTGVKLEESEQTRNRKLLLKQREIDRLLTTKKQGMTIIPIEILTGGRYIKIKIASGRGKRKYDKRQSIQKRDQKRQINRELKRR